MRIFLITAPPNIAESLAEQLLSEHLIACANILPDIRSLYWWKGALQKDEESLILVKTRDELAQALIERVKAIHPYEVPEVIALEVKEGNPDYLEWVERETTGSQ